MIVLRGTKQTTKSLEFLADKNILIKLRFKFLYKMRGKSLGVILCQITPLNCYSLDS